MKKGSLIVLVIAFAVPVSCGSSSCVNLTAANSNFAINIASGSKSCAFSLTDKQDGDQVAVNINTLKIDAEIVISAEARNTGLMYRESLPEKAGVLFVYQSPLSGGFWMKNTLIPLDIIFIDSDFKIVDIKRNFMPCTEDPCPVYEPAAAYQYALEINGGMADSYGISTGDGVTVKTSP